MEEYLTIKEVSVLLKVTPKTVQNKMTNGTFIKGIHYFSPKGIGPRFKWSAVVCWLEGNEKPTAPKDEDGIPMARGYLMGEPSKKPYFPLDKGSI